MVWVDSSDKYQQILNAAEKVFGQNGYAKATVEAIADEAGVGKGTVYLYFKNKEDVFLSVIENRVAKHLNFIDSQLQRMSTPRELLTTILVSTVEFFLAHRGFMNVLWEAFRFADEDWQERLLKCQQEINDRLLVHVFKMVNSGSGASARTVLDVVMGAVHAVVAGRLLRNEEVDPQSTAEEITALLLPGILGVNSKQQDA